MLGRLSDPHAPVVLPIPAYMPFLTVPGLVGRELITVPMALDGNRYSLDLPAIAAALPAGRGVPADQPAQPDRPGVHR